MSRQSGPELMGSSGPTSRPSDPNERRSRSAGRGDQVVLAEELLGGRGGDEVEGVGADVGEDFVGEVGERTKRMNLPDEEVGGEAAGLAESPDQPELGWV
ncbi:uncharacterized protein A4U43_C01F25840 [Asparagus officinalis]|uniref:Uncharacterized protein n=1 Tax=Asparagus officinalis TaxID=4686 RepID=A0A5P1FSS7_ASPOF|nr:uncharacterized protein A4U43_C01F25840 [Asparagus officinalis]